MKIKRIVFKLFQFHSIPVEIKTSQQIKIYKKYKECIHEAAKEAFGYKKAQRKKIHNCIPKR